MFSERAVDYIWWILCEPASTFDFGLKYFVAVFHNLTQDGKDVKTRSEKRGWFDITPPGDDGVLQIYSREGVLAFFNTLVLGHVLFSYLSTIFFCFDR